MQKALHLVFIDLEKAYDRVPRQEVWRCLREQGVDEKNVRLVKDTYEDARTQVKTSIGLTGKITVRVGLHQGSSLSPYLFDLILDVMGRGIKEQPPGICCLKMISCCAALYVERGSSVGRMPDSQSREPEFESPLLPFRSLGIFFHFTTPQSTQLYK